MEPLAILTDLQDRLPFTMSDDEKREAEGALIDLSDEARYYGSARWATPALTPYSVVNLILKAAARHMKNYEGYTQSRAGDEVVAWAEKRDGEVGSASFSPAERERLADLGGNQRTGFGTAGMFAFQRSDDRLKPVGLVPDAQSPNAPIRMFSHETEPW